ncbi:hypothetical protein Tco_0253040 [Tanacetum coccineum]
MAALKFADSHNMVAFLEKPAQSDGFEEIVDFLNAHTINDLRLEDAEGIECLPSATIFEELTRMGYEKLSQKLTFYKVFFSPQWKFLIHTSLQCLSNEGNFLMYPRLVQVFLDNQFGDMSTHDEIYVTPSHTKKVFMSMKRVGKGFSRNITPLFPTIMVQAQEELGEGSAGPTNPQHTPTIIQPSTSKPQKKQPRRKQRKDTEVPQPTEPVADETEDNVPTHSNDPLLSVLALETTKTNQALEIKSLKRRVKRLEKKQRSRTHKLKRLYKVGLSARIESSNDEASLGDQEDASKQGRKIHNIDADQDITLKNVQDADMFRVQDLQGDEVIVDVAATTVGDTTTTTNVEVTLAQALIEIKTSKPKAKGIVFKEPSESTTTTTPTPIVSSQQPSQAKDKGKAIMVEEPVKTKKKVQIMLDEEAAKKLQAKFDEEARVQREKEEVNAALIAQWNDIQDKVETDYELAQRLQQEEQEELTIEEKSKLFQQLLEKRRKFFAAKRVEEKRNKPPTKAQQRSFMCTYLKNMEGWKLKDLKNKYFTNIQELFGKKSNGKSEQLG